MTIIQAHRRTKTYVHTFPDVALKFEPNAVGDVVCDVKLESAVDRLLATPTGFRVYVNQPEPALSVSPLLAGTKSPADDQAAAEAAELAAKAEAKAKAEAEAAAKAHEELNAPRFVLVNGENSLDLRAMADDALHAFAKANGINVHPNTGRLKVLNKIADAFAEAAAEDKPDAGAAPPAGAVEAGQAEAAKA